MVYYHLIALFLPQAALQKRFFSHLLAQSHRKKAMIEQRRTAACIF